MWNRGGQLTLAVLPRRGRRCTIVVIQYAVNDLEDLKQVAPRGADRCELGPKTVLSGRISRGNLYRALSAFSLFIASRISASKSNHESGRACLLVANVDTHMKVTKPRRCQHAPWPGVPFSKVNRYSGTRNSEFGTRNRGVYAELYLEFAPDESTHRNLALAKSEIGNLARLLLP